MREKKEVTREERESCNPDDEEREKAARERAEEQE